jgi:serine/threonine protein kinase
MKVIHRDIKPPNILIDNNGQIKLIDFGLSAIIESGKLQNTFCGSPAYTAPEIVGCHAALCLLLQLAGNTYAGKPADVWSLAVLVYLMVAKKLPFDCVQKTLVCEWSPPENVSAGIHNTNAN